MGQIALREGLSWLIVKLIQSGFLSSVPHHKGRQQLFSTTRTITIGSVTKCINFINVAHWFDGISKRFVLESILCIALDFCYSALQFPYLCYLFPAFFPGVEYISFIRVRLYFEPFQDQVLKE